MQSLAPGMLPVRQMSCITAATRRIPAFCCAALCSTISCASVDLCDQLQRAQMHAPQPSHFHAMHSPQGV